ncbi:AraC-like DNA-binding protein [Chryseobacterium ginsenosidimutans]|uniref:helix-turn-helix domain-containing protein n=1 Tax=Chryseobacterium ginsenosidimutans TaxID=687846 RepID=UPI002788BCF1|nr:helix-turn-helix domain-containing protein [Chryseobacterium ginsenosidimutans]MDQ0594194.1 AraC-like DNA-binding protein [Chryseobacterium ginsenosidimutans]
MKVNFYQPIDPILKKYIEGYYFMSKDECHQPFKYLTFPDNYFILSACQNVSIVQEKGWLEIHESSTENLIIDFVSQCSVPMEILYQQTINEVTVYFKPLGIYHFFEADSSADLKTKIQDSDFKEIMDRILKEPDRKTQIQMLEEYWILKFKLKDMTLAYTIASDIDSEFTIEEIAAKNNITRQYVNKISKKYLGKPASEYRKIQRFRKVLISNKKVKNLTELSYENLFYDQSHFIKDFKELTKISPKKFFENVDTEQNNIWLFI